MAWAVLGRASLTSAYAPLAVRWWAVVLLSMCVSVGQSIGAAPPGGALGGTTPVVPPTTTADGTTVLGDGAAPLHVTGIEIEYHKPLDRDGRPVERSNLGLPDTGQIMNLVVVLGAAPEGLVSATVPPDYQRVRPKLDVEAVRLADIGQGRYQWLYPSAIQEIRKRIFRHYTERGIMGVFVRPLPEDISLTRDDEIESDLRTTGTGPLRLEVFLGRVAEVRTIASGDRIAVKNRINAPEHQWIAERSPVQKASEHRVMPLRKDELDKYVLWLNQHPGRHVDVSIASENVADPEAVTLDYLVSESKPWIVYGQISNTGTEQTSDWRERIGFTHNQLTDRDDILTLDYTTAGFEDSHSIASSYEAPWPGMYYDAHRPIGRVPPRWRVYALYDEFTASDVGRSALDFTGDTHQVGAELIFNILQRRELFIYAVGGARFEHMRVHDETPAAVDATGKVNYFTPYLGLRMQAIEETRATLADLTVLRAIELDSENLERLGRSEPDPEFTAVQANMSHAFFLEPLFNPQEFRANRGKLAQEIALALKGQWVPDARLIPQYQQTAGGFYTVRGYPESVSAGDSVIVASAEYRFHIPRNLDVRPDPTQTELFGRFRVAPQQPYGRPDWDLIPRAFIDVGQTCSNDRLPFEQNDVLIGAGLGLEFQFKQNVNLRCDWGVALREIENPAGELAGPIVSSGSQQFHISFTVLY